MLPDHVIIPGLPEKRTRLGGFDLPWSKRSLKKPASKTLVIAHWKGAEAPVTAVKELETALSSMTGREVGVRDDPGVAPREIVVSSDGSEVDRGGGGEMLAGDAFRVERAGAHSIRIRAGSDRGLIHAAADLVTRLGARLAPGVAPFYPRIDAAAIGRIEPYAVVPSFARRAFVSDIMTWNYNFADRLELHLGHDREFIPWMARRGINAFSYIRHAHDTRLRIDEIAGMLREHGIGAEYGGHVLQLLLPRERFESDPAMFPADEDGNRLASGNLCVSNRAALEIVRDGAIRYVAEYPENELLHIWGADVRRGAWCRCGGCRELAPQHQYMAVVNAVAESLAAGAHPRQVAYLAYHDTIDPYPGLHPLGNVWVEWAPRERCYSHAIDDSDCETNPRYFESLKRYLEIFDGRCHVFEYYADAILFGGLAFATPEVIARDIRAYHAIGIGSISCLTFGAFSLLAYPVNIETFVRCARDAGADPQAAGNSVASGRHPACSAAMGDAYRAIADASAMVLDYADVMHPRMEPGKARRKRGDLERAARMFHRAIDAAGAVLRSRGEPLARGEHQLWRYSARVLEGIAEYLGAKECAGRDRAERGEAAIAKIAEAIEHVRAIDLEIKGTWGAYDLEWIREAWLAALRRGLEANTQQHQEMP